MNQTFVFSEFVKEAIPEIIRSSRGHLVDKPLQFVSLFINYFYVFILVCLPASTLLRSLFCFPFIEYSWFTTMLSIVAFHDLARTIVRCVSHKRFAAGQ